LPFLKHKVNGLTHNPSRINLWETQGRGNRPFDLPTLSLGAIGSQEGDQVLVREDLNNYQKLILRDGTVAGIILQGEIGGSGFWQHLIKNKIRVDRLEKSLWKLSYADFYGVEDNGEYKWVV
jgi:hypothetical protein